MINNRNCLCMLVAFVSAVLGVALGIVAFSNIIVGIIAALWIAFAIGIGALLLVILFAGVGCVCRKINCCIGRHGGCLAMGALGTIVTTVVALAIPIVTGSVAVAVLLGFVTFFLVFTLLNILRLVRCLIRVD